MRTNTARTHRAAVILSGAVAALLVGSTTAPAVYAHPSDKPASHGKKVGHAKKADKPPAKRSSSSTRDTDKPEPQSTGGDHRASSNKDGQGHNDQWQAQADPDGDENGGIDQPGGNGGHDPVGWDGNNGSGNDPDCEDDNRGKGVPGHCKIRPNEPAPTENPTKPRKDETEKDTSGETPSTAPTLPGGNKVVTETVTEVLGVERFSGEVSRTAAGRVPAAATPAAGVAPVEASEVISDGMLPDTGADAAMLAMLAGGLAAAGAGTAMVRRGRTSRG